MRRAVWYSASSGRMTLPDRSLSISRIVASPSTCAMRFLLRCVVLRQRKEAGFARSLQRGEPSLLAEPGEEFEGGNCRGVGGLPVARAGQHLRLQQAEPTEASVSARQVRNLRRAVDPAERC